MKESAPIPEVTFCCDHYINHNSFIIAGLCDLVSERKIRLRFRLLRPVVSDRNYWISYVVVKYPSGRSLRIAFDFHDFANFYCSRNLEISDLYFRANFSQAVVDEMRNREHAAKMRPFGLYFAPRPNVDKAVGLRYMGSIVSAFQKYGFFSFLPVDKKKMYALYSQIYINYFANYRDKLKVAQYHSFISKPEGPAVFFNPRCWAETDDSVRKVNSTRAEIIRLCRKELGEKFLGGFINTDYARKNYPDAVLEKRISHADYIRLVQSSPVNIYTQGLNNCISWKLMEYFAAGSAVVGERISNDLPVGELGDGIFFPFENAEQCVSNIMTLLGDAERLSAIRYSAYRHYESRLMPARKLERIIFDSASTP